jgi:hypothetical protein
MNFTVDALKQELKEISKTPYAKIIYTNNEQKKFFSKHYEILIELGENSMLIFHFKPNFPFADEYKNVIDKITNATAQRLIGMPESASVIYRNAIKDLTEYFNPLDIGIVIDPDIIKMFDKKEKLLAQYSLYAETFKQYQTLEKPSFEEWQNWESKELE